MHRLDPTQRIRQWSLWLWVWRVHRWIGLSFAAVLMILSVTGSLLVLHAELDHWTSPIERPFEAPPAGTARAPLVPVLQQLQQEAPAGFRPLRLEPGHDAASPDKIVFVGLDRVTRWSALVNPWSGEVLWRGADQSLLLPWLLHLHMHLHLGVWGYVLCGIAGVALTCLGLTGLWITRDRITRLLRRPFRLSRGGRIAASDLHKWTGLVSIYFSLVLGATGVWFSILVVPAAFERDRRPPLAPAFDLARLAPIEPAIAAAQREFPGAELARVIFPWDAKIDLQVRVLHREAPIWEKYSRIDFNPATGEIVRIRRASEASTAEKWRSILGPLHFGNKGAPWVKWLYVIGGLTPTVLAVTGTIIWYFRRRNTAARKPLPG